MCHRRYCCFGSQAIRLIDKIQESPSWSSIGLVNLNSSHINSLSNSIGGLINERFAQINREVGWKARETIQIRIVPELVNLSTWISGESNCIYIEQRKGTSITVDILHHHIGKVHWRVNKEILCSYCGSSEIKHEHICSVCCGLSKSYIFKGRRGSLEVYWAYSASLRLRNSSNKLKERILRSIELTCCWNSVY